MTRFTILLLSLFFAKGVNAQVSHGTIPLGGAIEINKRYDIPDEEKFILSVSPFAGYYFNDNFGIQGGFSYNQVDREIDNYRFAGLEGQYDGLETNSSVFVAFRSYFPFLDYRLFGQLDLIRTKSYENEQFSTIILLEKDTASTEFTSKISIGANTFLSDNISLDWILKYNFIKDRSVEDRSRVFKGPIEFILDIRPYITDGFGGSGRNAYEYLSARSWNVGGSLAFRHSLFDNRIRVSDSTYIDNTFINISFQPKIGYFLTDNFLIGANLLASYTDNKGVNPEEYAIAPFFRYYVRVSESLQLVPNFLATWRYSELRRELLNSSIVDRSFQFSPGIGFHFFITEGVGVFANGIMDFQTRIDAEDVQLDRKNVNQLKLQIGLEYYLSEY